MSIKDCQLYIEHIQNIYGSELLETADIQITKHSKEIVSLLQRAESEQYKYGLQEILAGIADIIGVNMEDYIYWLVYIAILSSEKQDFSCGNMLQSSMIVGKRSRYSDPSELDEHGYYRGVGQYFTHPDEE